MDAILVRSSSSGRRCSGLVHGVRSWTAAPDTVVEFDLTLQAQNDTSRVDSKTIGVSASMLSDATVGLTDVGPEDRMLVEAGSQISLKYTIHNNASRQDIFSMRVEVDNPGMWTVHQPTRPDAVLNSGGSTTFTVMVDVPTCQRPRSNHSHRSLNQNAV